MNEWWNENGPPVYIAVAGYLGLINTDKPKGSKSSQKGNLEDLLALAGPGGMLQ